MSRHVNIPPSSSGGSCPDAASVALDRARELLGNTIDTVLGTHFQNSSYHVATVTGSGAITMSTTAKAGVIVLTSAATANSAAITRPAGPTCFLDAPRTTLWYAVARGKITTAVDAQTSVSCLHMRAVPTAGVGPITDIDLSGSLSTGFFSCRVLDNSAVAVATQVTSVALDTNYHTFEIWSDGTTTSFAIDGTVVFTTPTSNLGTNPQTLAAVATNGTTAAARTCELDYQYFCCPSN